METTPEFVGFPKMARLSREVVITEKIDGTNASIAIFESKDGFIPDNCICSWAHPGLALFYMMAASRTRWITPNNDNHGFARWVSDNDFELMKLGPGHHFGEWWGSGIQRGYGLKEKQFSLFNVDRWCRHDEEPQVIGESWDDATKSMIQKLQTPAPACCHIVPVLYRGIFSTDAIECELDQLGAFGSRAAPGFMNPEGIVVYHIAGRVGFKKTLKDDDKAKGAA